MVYITMESRCVLLCLVLACLCVAITSGQSADGNSLSRGSRNHRSRSRCTDCTVNGKEYRGHSRFQYEEDCYRYRCTCKCDGSYNCPARYTQNICDEEGNRRPDSATHTSRRRQCQACVVNGKEYPGHAYFRYVDDCTTIDNCICYCNGTHKCPEGRARNTCEGGEDRANNAAVNDEGSRPSDPRRQSAADNRRNNRCPGCVAKGKEIRGNSYFDLEDGCTAFTSCVCYCNGTWSCPASRARNICEPGAVSTTSETPSQAECRACQLNGQTFDGQSTFEYRDGCKAYTNCNCHCNGSWACPASGVVDMCSPDDRGQDGRCQDCSIMGNVYPSNRSFEIRDGCIEYSNCSCFCNGSWHCPENSARDVCKKDTRDNDRQPQRCGQCNAKGQIFDGGSYFELTDGCIEYKDCICRCNGSWSCPGDRASYICGTDRELDVGGRRSCRECEVYGDTFPANRNFTIKRGCIEYRDCRCHCNGSWACPGSSARDVCKAERESRDRVRRPSNRSDRCSVCNAHNMEVEGNSYFELSDGCWEYKNCFCHCNGTWNCPNDSARNICDQTETDNKDTECVSCSAKGRSFAGNSQFELVDGCNHYMACVCNCDGSWNCPAEHARNTCEAEPIQDSCRICEAKDGSVHQPNRPFKFMDGCIERDCDCFCNGSWACPGNRSRWACTDKCRQCDVDGRKVANNTEFKHNTGCLEYTCTCHCNGSWSCPGETVKNTCPVGVRDNCNTCQISATEEYPGESDFVLKQGCLHYKCRCNCDGSYNCPAKDSRNVCHGEVLGGCRSCVVSDSEIYRGETDFRLRQDCIDYQCRCSCDGTWKCPGEKARNICLGEVPGGCKVCQVAEGEVYRANTVFDLRKECLHYRCKCNCDGSWSCPGEDTRNVCRGEVPGGCRSCVISENEYYRGNTDFEMTKDCIHYQCRCNCDGSYNCPGETARRVCSTDGSRTSPRRCQRCRVSGGQEFEGNTNFTLMNGCTRRSCICRCDGSWECPAESNICRNNSISQQPQRQQVPVEQRQPCRKCRRNGKEYPGNSDFKLNRGCYEYDCSCKCNGRMSCDRPRYVCDSNRGNRQTNGERRGRPERTEAETCKSCDVAGQSVNARDKFYVDIGCKRYSECECRCTGDWTCGQKEDICDGSASGSQRDTTPVVVKTGTSSRQQTVNTDREVSRDRKTGTNSKRGSNFVTPDYNSSRRRQNYIRQSTTTFTTSGSTPNKNQYIQQETGSSGVGNGRSAQCQQCVVDDETYETGASFEMRRECVIYKCVCLCTGSYRCRPYSDSACKKEETESSCSNCVHHGLVYPGGRGFTVRDGCTERECNCFCNGTYTCPTSRDLPGCRTPGIFTQRDGTNAVNVNYYRINGQPIRPGIPVLDTANRRRYVTGNTYSTNSRNISCLGCLVEEELRQGGSAFTFEKDCTEFICYCACGGSWKCEGRPSLSCPPPGPAIPKITAETQSRIADSRAAKTQSRIADSRSLRGSEAGRVDAYGCRSCLVQGTEYPSRARFSLRQGCYQYRCTCNCDGSWDCPQQSVAYLCSDRNNKDRSQDRYNQRGSRGRPQTAASMAKTYVTDERGNIRVENPAELVNKQGNSSSGWRTKTSSGAEVRNVGCRPCTVDGQRVHPLATFIRQLNCLETICRCQCHGVHSCPASASVNICELTDNKPISERKGCQVGRRTHFTRVFAKVENCLQRTCVCHDDGTWECRRTADDIKVC